MIVIDAHSIAQLKDVVSLDAAGAHAVGWLCQIWTSANASLLDAPVPEPWQAGCWRWNGEMWSPATIPDGYAEWLIARVDAERDARIGAGMPYTFPDGKGTVQLRNQRDLVNVTGVGTSGMMLVAAGDAETPLGFRDQEDVTHALTSAQAQALGQAVMAWVSAHYAATWAHKDALGGLAAAGDDAALAAYDIRTGWPA